MSSASHAFSSKDTRSVIYRTNQYPLTAPCLYQDSEGQVEVPDVMESNDVILTSTHRAKFWFDGVRSLIFNNNDDVVYRYGRVDSSRVKNSQNTRHLKGNVLILGAAGAHCYYHWMVDALPKLEVLRAAGIDLDSIDHFVHFIVPGTNVGFQNKSLKHLGIDESKVVLANGNANFSADLLYHVEIRNFVGMKMHHFIPEFLKKTFLDKTLPNKYGKKIFISRPKGVNRAVTNEDELLELVSSHGYEVVTMEGMSLQEQASLFYNADSIIATHGGALTNIVYCKQGTELIELFQDHVFSYYYGLANLCQLKYKPVLKNMDYIDRVVDPFVGNVIDDQQVTIRKDSTVELSVLEKILK